MLNGLGCKIENGESTIDGKENKKGNDNIAFFDLMKKISI
jgi:hypothetical protein